MNKAQRKQIAEAIQAIQAALSALEDAAAPFEQFGEDEQEKYDNMPESLQNGERGEALQAGAEALTALFDAVTEARESIESAIGDLEGAM